MKIAAQPLFWPLRPRLTARGAELACGLIILMLAAALLSIRATPGARSFSAPSASLLSAAGTGSSAVFATQEVGVFPRRCIRRILDLMPGLSQVEIVNEIERQCFTRAPHRPQAATPEMAPPICIAPRTFAPPLVPGRVTGCLLH
jgi:hypothetical protein